MIEIGLTVNKVGVYDEVAKTTSYTGAKMQEDSMAYGRIFTTDDDRMMLERFWMEACNVATQEFKPFLMSVSGQQESHGMELERNYEVALEMSSSFDERLVPSMQTSLFCFFVNYITGKWYKFTNKAETEQYITEANVQMLDVKKKLYFRRKPTRVVPKD